MMTVREFGTAVALAEMRATANFMSISPKVMTRFCFHINGLFLCTVALLDNREFEYNHMIGWSEFDTCSDPNQLLQAAIDITANAFKRAQASPIAPVDTGWVKP